MGPHLDVWYGTVPNGEMAITVRRRREPNSKGGKAALGGDGKPEIKAQFRKVSTLSGMVDQPWLIGTSLRL